jgi:ribosomal protein L37E
LKEFIHSEADSVKKVIVDNRKSETCVGCKTRDDMIARLRNDLDSAKNETKTIVKYKPQHIQSHQHAVCDDCGRIHHEHSKVKLPKKYCVNCGYPSDGYDCKYCNKPKPVAREKFREKLEDADYDDDEQEDGEDE